MNERSAQLTMLWGALIMEELYRLGVRDICIAPGSRSTPLTLSAAEHSGLKKHIHFDERGLGFFALGCAKATDRPVVLICSSGTAAANFFPAVVEANMDGVPLLVLTADRPGELQDVGANQSINQHQLFGNHVSLFRQLHTPSDGEPVEAVLTLIDDAIEKTAAGPVHINCMFREPFVPTQRIDMMTVPPLAAWVAGEEPYTQQLPVTSMTVAVEMLKPLAAARKGLLVVGRMRKRSDVEAAKAIADHLKWPTCADIGSGLRLGNDAPYLISYAEMLLDSTDDLIEPDLILHIGGGFTSKKLTSFLKTLDHIPMLQVRPEPGRLNPLHRPSTILAAGLPQFAEAVQRKVWAESALAETWFEHHDQCKLVVEAESIKGLSNVSVATTIAKTIGQDHIIYIGNSLPIRDMDNFAPAACATPVVCVNRGASGIDGNIATAAGFAGNSRQPLTLLVGDLTVLHDLNSISLLDKLKQPVSLVVINNNGGGIFHKLPIATQTEHFETYFATPHGYTFKNVAKMFGMTYHSPGDLAEFESVYARSLNDGKHLIEVTLPR